MNRAFSETPMNPHRTMSRFAATVLFTTISFALAAVAVGCGGGSDSTTSSGPVATFTPDPPAPSAGTIALLAGSSNGTSVDVRVTVTEVPGFFGAAFRIDYDTNALLFNGMTDSGSFLRVGVTDPSQLFFDANATSQPGSVVITATRFYPAVPVPGAATGDLVVLNFIARVPIAAGAAAGRLKFDSSGRRVCNGTVAPPDCAEIVVTWSSGGGVSAQ